MATIAAPDITIQTMAAFAERLMGAGVTEDDLVRSLGSSSLMDEIAKSLKTPIRVPKKLDAVRCEKLIWTLFPYSYDENGNPDSDSGYLLYGEERDWLNQPDQVRSLLKHLTLTQLRVTVDRSGLTGKPIKDAASVAHTLGITANRVNKIRGDAKKIMCERAVEMVGTRRRSPYPYEL